MILTQNQQQRQILSVAMQQSLGILQLPVLALGEYLSEIAMENPMIEIDDGMLNIVNTAADSRRRDEISWQNDYSGDVFERRRVKRTDGSEPIELADEAAHPESFTEHLLGQLNHDKSIPESFLPLCGFLVESLNARGYLEDPMEQLAGSMGIPLDDAMQALYVVQSLTPTGVGARSLEECLILQLAQSRNFNAYTLKIVNECLPLLAKNNITAIAKKLGLKKAEAQVHCDVIRQLNPIPSRGFSGASVSHYSVPEAMVDFTGDTFVVHYNSRAIPRIRLNQEYEKMLRESEGEVQEYLKKNRSQARRIMQDLDNRETTLTKVIQNVLSIQREYLLGNRTVPVPLTVQELAEKLSLHPSTVSRAVKDKYITFNGKSILLKSLFAAPVNNGGTLSKKMILEQLQRLVDAEDKTCPLTDEGIVQALKAMNITVSRRTVAAYRTELGIPATSGRHARNN